jgi:hypothetical protein
MPFTRLGRISDQVRRSVFVLVEPIPLELFSLFAAAWILGCRFCTLQEERVLYFLSFDWSVFRVNQVRGDEADRFIRRDVVPD